MLGLSYNGLSHGIARTWCQKIRLMEKLVQKFLRVLCGLPAMGIFDPAFDFYHAEIIFVFFHNTLRGNQSNEGRNLAD